MAQSAGLGDKKYVLPSLLAEFAGKVNLIYIDPAFDTGQDFSFTATVPEHSNGTEDDSFFFTKEPSIKLTGTLGAVASNPTYSGSMKRQ
jgi:hypothetical protein